MSKIFSRRSYRNPVGNPVSIRLQEDDEEDFDDCKSSSSESAPIITINNRYNFRLPSIDLQRVQAVTARSRFTLPEVDINISVHRAAKEGVAGILRHILSDRKNHHDINRLDEYEMAPLHYAVLGDHVDIVKYLIEIGADVNVRGEFGQTPLHFTAMKNSICLKTLLAHHADSSIEDLSGCTAMHLAIKYGHRESVETLLLEKPTQANLLMHRVERNGLTLLHHTAKFGRSTICELFLASGADPMRQALDGTTAYHLAAAKGNIRVMEVILQAVRSREINIKSFVNSVDNEGETALHLAVQNGHSEATKLCLDHGAEVNAQRKNLYTPMHIAAIKGYINIGQILAGHGCRLNIRDVNHMTPLHRAALYNRVDFIKFLIKKHAKINMRDGDHFTPVLCASWKGHTEAVDCLLQHGARLDIRDKDGKTCLHWAADHDHVGTIKILLENSGQELINCEDDLCQTALFIAAQRGYIQAIRLLLANGAQVEQFDRDENTPLHLAARSGRIQCVQVICEMAPKLINSQNKRGRTPLHFAVIGGHKDIVLYFLKQGNNDILINASDLNKNTALHLASAWGHENVVKVLLERGADVTLLNSENQTCLDVAIENCCSSVGLAIIQSKYWDKVMDIKAYDGFSPMKRLIEKMPTVAEEVLDKCIEESHHSRENFDYSVAFNFSYMESTPEEMSTGIEFFAMAVRFQTDHGNDITVFKILPSLHHLDTMAKFNRVKLLQHPLTISYSRMKWDYGEKFVLYFNMFFYMLFVTFMTVYVVQASRDFGRVVSTTVGPSVQTNGTQSTPEPAGPLLISCQTLIFLLTIICGAKEGLQLAHQNWKYFLDPVNYLELTVYISAMVFIQPIGYKPDDFQWQVGTIAIFLAWMNLILFLQRIQYMGLYVLMFVSVLKTVLKVSIVVFMFIIAYAVAFNMLLRNQGSYSNLGIAITKVIISMLGEIDYVDTYVNAKTGGAVPYPNLTLIFLVMFAITMNIVLVNLMIGLAVGDIGTVQQHASMQKLAKKVDFTTALDSAFPYWYRKRFLHKPSMTIYPNRYTNIFNKVIQTLRKRALNNSSLSYENEKNDSSDYTLLRREVENEALEIDGMSETINSLQKAVNFLAARYGIEVDEGEDEYMYDYEM
ncbi:Transient receptor potential cation channel subfamily A member 1 [Trichoplax sp. H2]|nr:Transient receptor potential cation channel subfamily A member 1 [Trichoplax sp. H2]|eukprot:RDD38141.1 Transient receptor potential cation channel subfamily A member 1 [Trichoplax sp. H2]